MVGLKNCYTPGKKQNKVLVIIDKNSFFLNIKISKGINQIDKFYNKVFDSKIYG